MKMIFAISTLLFSLTSLAQNLKINVLALTGADASDERRIYGALKLIEDVVNTEEFRTRVLDMSYKIGKSTYKGYSQTDSSPEEVLNSILLAKENFAGGRESEIDLFLDMYYKRNSTIGYTGPKDKFIHMNRYFHSRYTSLETAGNIFHEWLHKIGHGHSQRHNDFRPHSVPYKIGKLMIEMAAEVESGGNSVLKAKIIKEMSHVNCKR
jgi:hypothetical protein